MDLNGVISDMARDIREVEPRLLEYWEQCDYLMARAEFLGFLARSNYHHFATRISEGFDRGVAVVGSITYISDLLNRGKDFSTRSVESSLKQLKASLAQTALSDGPVDLTIRL